MDSEYANYKKVTLNLSQGHTIYLFLDFLMHRGIKWENLYIENYCYIFIYNGSAIASGLNLE